MSYAKLYDAAQGLQGKISTRWLRDEAIGLSSITKIKEQWTGVLDESSIRGFFVEGPLEPPVPLEENEALIVLARSLNKHWRRFVYTKELMHVFDEPDEKANTPEKFDAQAEKFGDPSAQTSPQYRAESKAFWRAIAILCREEKRLEYKAAIDAEEMSLEVVSTALQIPSVYARHLFRDDFLTILGHVKT